MRRGTKYILHTDGASRGNPGHASAAWVIFKDIRNPFAKKKEEDEGYIPEDKYLKVEFEGSKYLGIQTNNFAEYSAIVEGLKACLEQGIDILTVKMDSELATNQINGYYKVKSPNIIPFIEEINQLKEKFVYVRFVHVYRSKNKAADKLANKCLDEYLSQIKK